MLQSLAQRGFAVFSFSAVIFRFLTYKYNAVVEREREENTMIDVVMFLSLSLSLFLRFLSLIFIFLSFRSHG